MMMYYLEYLDAGFVKYISNEQMENDKIYIKSISTSVASKREILRILVA